MNNYRLVIKKQIKYLKKPKNNISFFGKKNYVIVKIDFQKNQSYFNKKKHKFL